MLMGMLKAALEAMLRDIARSGSRMTQRKIRREKSNEFGASLAHE